jgi:hypothetical protein
LANPVKYLLVPDSGSGKIDIDSAIKRAQESIPETVLPVLSEPEIDTLLAASQQSNTIAVIALSGKSAPNGVLRNVALSVKGRVHFGFFGQPSPVFLERIGNPSVPGILALVPPTDGKNDQFQVNLSLPHCLTLRLPLPLLSADHVL